MKIQRTIPLIFVIIAGLFSSVLKAQPVDSTLVELIRDSRIDLLTAKQYALNKLANDLSFLSKYKTSGGKYKGFRLMILNTNNRELAYQTRGQIALQFPQYNVYLGYQAPYYKLKMGDFLERSDAEAFKKQLSGKIKQGVFIIPDAINLKPEEEEKLIEKLSKGNIQ